MFKRVCIGKYVTFGMFSSLNTRGRQKLLSFKADNQFYIYLEIIPAKKYSLIGVLHRSMFAADGFVSGTVHSMLLLCPSR